MQENPTTLKLIRQMGLQRPLRQHGGIWDHPETLQVIGQGFHRPAYKAGADWGWAGNELAASWRQRRLAVARCYSLSELPAVPEAGLLQKVRCSCRPPADSPAKATLPRVIVSAGARLLGLSNISSLDEDKASVSTVEFHPERGQQARTLGFALGSGKKREGKGESQGRFPDPEGFVGNQHVSEVAGQVAQGCEGRIASGAAFEGATPAPVGNRVAVAIPQWLTKRDAWGFCISPFPESSNRQVSTVWLDPELGPRDRGAGAHGWVGSQVSPCISFCLRGPEGGGTRGSPKQGVRYRSNASVGRQRAFEEGLDSLPWSESESSDEFSERQLRRVSTWQIGGGWAKPKSLNDTGSLWRSPVREEFLPMAGPCLSFRCREAGQAVRDPEVSSKEAHSDSWGKPGSRPSYLPLVAAAGGLPKATPRWKVSQEKRSLEGAPEVVREGFFHLRGQRRGTGAPQNPATFSRICAVPLLGTGTSHALTPFGTKESKPTGTGQESVAQRNSGSEPVVGEGDDKEPNREPFPESESLAHGQSTSFHCGYGGECDRGAVNGRHTQDPANLEPLALSEEQVLTSGPAPSSDLEPPEELPRRERLQQPQPQQPPGPEASPQCEEFQREIHALRQPVATMQALADKLQKL